MSSDSPPLVQPGQVPIESPEPGEAPDGPPRMQLARDLLRVVRRDPYHLPENLILLAQERLAAPSLEWGDRGAVRP